MGWFSDLKDVIEDYFDRGGHTLIYCDLSDCKHIKKHALQLEKSLTKEEDKYINVCGLKYLSLYRVGKAALFHNIPPVVCQYYEPTKGVESEAKEAIAE